MPTDYIVFVVDDDQAVRDSLRWLLESVGHRVETYSSAGAFLKAFDADRPGCLIVDVRMPGISGLALQEQLNARTISTPVIMITGHGDVPMAVQAMKAGAMEFIEKPFNDQVLLDLVQQCLSQEAHKRKELETKADVLRRAARLTPREHEVLEAVIAGNPNKTIAKELGISIKTVEIHRARGMEKMHANSVAELVTLYVQFDLHKGKP